MPKVSAIIPTYNRSSLIKDTICSVLAQTETDLEVLVVDDGSTDDTRSVIKGLNDERVIYFYKTNGGPASARNFGLSKANGEYIAFLDSDDFWPANYLEVMVSHLETQKQYGLAYCSFGFSSADGIRMELRNKPKNCKTGWVTADLFHQSFVSLVASVVRRELIEDFGFDELLHDAEDSDFFLRLSLRAQFLYVPGIYVYIKSSPDSFSGKAVLNCSRVLSLERFYYKGGGKEVLSPQVAKVKLSHAYRRSAKKYHKKSGRKAALFLYKKAIRYWPLDIRLYIGFVQTMLLNKKKDSNPAWQMPKPLDDPMSTNRF